MTKENFNLIENYMLVCVGDSAHDKEHIYRVLYTALHIAEFCENVNTDILVAACLLHDTARQEQLQNPKICHAEKGAEKAYEFLTENGFEVSFSEKVSECILTHRFRNDREPQSIEAKILFDADKIDVAGAMGIARTLIYSGETRRPLYSLVNNTQINDGTVKDNTFFAEYKFKLEKLYDRFYTEKGREIALLRKKNAEDFYNNLLKLTGVEHNVVFDGIFPLQPR